MPFGVGGGRTGTVLEDDFGLQQTRQCPFHRNFADAGQCVQDILLTEGGDLLGNPCGNLFGLGLCSTRHHLYPRIEFTAGFQQRAE